MKKLFSLFAAALVLTLAATPAIAQTAIKPDGTPTALQADASSNLKVTPVNVLASPTFTSIVSLGSSIGSTNGASDAAGTGLVGLSVVPYNLVFNGTAWDRQRGDANGTVTQPALAANYWAFAGASGGIVNTTTAVTMKAAAGAGVRNYICTLNVGHDALGAATELAVRDGAAGTVIFRMKLQTAANEGASEITFAPCLKGTANTLMEVVTLTASVTGGVFVNASGYTGI